MNIKIISVKKGLMNKEHKVVEVTKTNYTLDNGDVFEHTFDIDESVTPEEFQRLLDNAKNVIVDTLDKIEKDNF